MREEEDKFAAGEADTIINSYFFKKFMIKVQKNRGRASGHCEDSKDDVRYYQGQVKAIDEILALPNILKNELRAKADSS